MAGPLNRLIQCRQKDHVSTPVVIQSGAEGSTLINALSKIKVIESKSALSGDDKKSTLVVIWKNCFIN